MELLAQTSKPPLLILFVLNGSKIKVDVKWGEKTALVVKSPQNFSLSSESAIVKFIALNKGLNWLGNDADEEAEVGHWVRFSHGQLSCASDYSDAVAYLDKKIQPVTYFVGNHLTLADLAVFSVLIKSKDWNNSEKPTNLMRWFKMISDLDFVRSTIESLPDCVKLIKKEGRKEEGKFVELPDAEMGKVIVRFPPEASGYLHIGHAKAALLNQYYKEAFDGKLIMRFDDTNPAKEKVDFEKVILEDLKLLKIPYDIYSHTSDHFDYILTLCEKLLKEGKAYVDDTEPELMKNEREQKVESKNRSNDVDKNFKMWKEMLNGTEYGQKCCVRAKIDMSSLNGCMRDPTIYRCKNEPHPKTGTKYKVYPTYDFACPIVDSIEGVTHCLRTMEYHDRDEQFYWFIDALGLRKPHIWEYSRLNMVNTVLSKRKLTWFVDNKYVDGWDDPRMPTVRGILRRGMTVEGLKQFIISQGSSRSVVVMEWDKIWAINKKVIDPIAPRYTAVSKDNVVVNIKGVKEEPLTVPKHPKNPEVGNKTVWVAPQVLIDQADADLLKEGENVTFINWGNILINKITRENGKVVSIEATPNLEDKNYKKTMKITFLAKTDKAPLIPCYCLYFDHIISKPILGKDEDFKDYINKNTLSVVESFVDPELASLKQFEIIQIQRKGFFICDRVYQPLSENIGQETPLAIIFIPDGHTKEMPTSVAPSKSIEKEKKVDGNKVASIASSIQSQGDLVRDLKAKKAGKDQIKTEVDKLLALKAEYKKLTGNDFQPGVPAPSVNAANKPGEVDEITNKIILQGDLVRDLKAKKAGKDEIKAEVDKLLALKGDYKKLTGKDYQPGAAPATPNVTNKQGEVDEITNKIILQGDLVRDLKAKKAGKDEIKAEVDKLLALKGDYKKLTGNDYQPGAAPATPNVTNKQGEVDEITKKIILQGDLVRDLKAKKAGKDEIKAEVDKLLALKGDYKKVTGKDYQPGAAPATPKVANNQVDDVANRIKTQGDLVRDLKAKKAGKDEIKTEVDKLLGLKAEYKKLTGNDFQPGAPTAKPSDKTADNKVVEITEKVKQQGDVVRDLKAKKASKDEIKVEVDKLLALKAEYKQLTGKDFPAQPPQKADKPAAPAKANEQVGDNKVTEITNKVKQQGDLVRDLKAKKASKDEIKNEVDKLLALKAEYKQLTGNDFPAQPPQKADKPAAPAKANEQVGDNKVTEITNKVKQQGDLVRDLKAKKASKDEIKNEVDKLLALKAEYKQLTGNDFPAQPTPVKVESNEVMNLTNDVKKQGDIVRDLKAKKAGKDDIDAAVKLLLELKNKYKELTGNDFPAEGRQKKQDAKPKAEKPAKQEKPKDKKQNDDSALKKVTRLGLEAEKEVDLPEWYSQVLTKGELIEYYDVSGCYILRPWSFAIWENIKDWFDAEIKKMGVKNCYFPIFVSRSVLEKEKTHIADFAPEVAWVTKSGDSDLAEPIAVRPTSETVMYPAYAKWIQSYRDLPIKLNQWNNVVRWEFKHPQPFLRTREFLWQEGHTAFASAEEAEEEVTKILDLYAQIYTDLLAIPVVKGRKTEKEKFAGGDFTLTAEAFISASGRAIQGATSHHLGQNFSKMFEIIYEDPVTHEKKFVFQNSWGITTRTIGVMIMVHADNQGLVLPPRVASLQIVIVPCGITAGLAESEVEKLHQVCEKLKNDLVAVGVRAETDLRSNYSPGWKYNHWELKGVPIRVEIGPKDLQKGEIVAVRRDNGGKTSIKSAGAVASLKSLLDTIQSDLLNKATVELNNHMFLSKDWKSFCQLLDEKNIIQAPFCGEIDCEDNIKNDSARNEDVDSNAPSMGAKSLCIPFSPLAQNSPNDKCIHPKCNRKSKYITLFGRSY